MRLMKYGLLALAAASILTGCTVHIDAGGFDTCRFREDRSATVPVDGARDLTVLARAGSLRIEGRPGLTEVRVTGTACATSESLVRDVQLRAEKTGSTVRVEAILPTVTVGNSPVLDLTLEVPDSMLARVDDSSGDIEIRGIAGADVTDQSGEIELIDVTGPVRLDDQSGDILVRNAGSDVVVFRDQSGNIRIDGVKGTVTVNRDESGEIEIMNVTGNVTIDEDESGSIEVRDVTGDFTVRRDGSGDIRHSNVKGHVSIPRK